MVCLAVLLAVFLGMAQEQTPSFTLKVHGQKTWGVQIGFGDPTLLSLAGLSPAQPTLTQSLWAQIEGTVLDFLTVRASFNDQLGPAFQDFLVIVNRKPWYAELGRFVVGGEADALGVYNKRVLGAKLTVSRENLGLSAFLARVEGIPESRTFRGTTAQAELTFHFDDPSQPWLPAPYRDSVEGLFYFRLRLPFIEGFSRPQLSFRTGANFAKFLEDWGLGYLQDLAEKNAVMDLPSGAYLVLRDEGDVLLLRTEPKVLLRNRLVELLDLYNTAQGLTGAARKTYPFVQGSALEAKFLAALSSLAEIRVDEEAYPLDRAERRRYLNLAETRIQEESFLINVRLPGEAEFRVFGDPALAAYSVRLFPEKGILRLDFPAEFFRMGAAIRVSFDYIREGATFFLGLSVIPGSERVYLNGRLLKKDADYTIDYQLGVLTLFVSLRAEDVLRVDFERQRGGLGVFSEYERYFLGTSLDFGSGKFGVWQAADLGAPSPTSRTMPNTHSLAALAWQGSFGEWNYSLRLGLSQNVFPFDDNARIPLPNQVNAIASVVTADGEVVVFAHQNGITVCRGQSFSSYGPGEGLAGRAALALLPLPQKLLIGTDSGLTIVELGEPGAFDRVRSWTRLYPDDWNKNRPEKFQGKRVLALAQDGTQVYMATEAELILVPLGSLTKNTDWRRLPLPLGEPKTLVWAETLYLGTTQALFRLVGTVWERIGGIIGPVYALLSRAPELLVATADGIRVIRAGIGSGWIVWGTSVRSLALWRDFVWYITEDGIFREGERTKAGNFTVLGVGLGAIWAGTKADQNYKLDLWRVDPELKSFTQAQTKIDGRDLSQFTNPPAEERTRFGPNLGLSLSRKLDNWEIGVVVYSRFPGYEEIGGFGRTDAHGLGFSARYFGGGQFSLNLRGRADLAELAKTPSLRLTSGVEGSWTGPITVSFSLSPTLSGPTGRSQLSSDLQLGLRAEGNPSWNLGFSGQFTTPEPYLMGTIRGGAIFQPWPGLFLFLSWDRPYRSQGPAGRESIILRGNLSGDAWRLSWEENFSHPVGEWNWTTSRTISAELRLAAFSLGAGRLAPNFAATASFTPAEERLSASLALPWESSAHRLTVTVGAGQGYRPATERTERTFSFNLFWSSTAWPGVQPSLRYAYSWKILVHPRYLPRVSEDQSLEARLGIDLPAGNRNDFTLSWSPGSGLKLANRLRYRAEFGMVEVETTLTLRDGKVTGKTQAQVGVSLGGQWGLNLEAGLLFGASPFRVAGYLGATLAVNF